MDFSSIGSGLVGAVIAFFLLGALLRSGKKKPVVDEDGWTHLTNTPGIFLTGLACIPFFLLFFLLVLAPVAAPHNENSGWFFLIGAPMAAFMAFGIYVIFVVAAKFNPKGIEYRRFKQWHHIPWSHLTQVVDHSMWGTYLKSDIGKLWIWKYRRGFAELLGKLCEHNIKGAKELAESDFEETLSAIEDGMIERVWEYREEELYPSLFGPESEGIFALTGDMFLKNFKCDQIDPRWLTYGVHVYAPTPQRQSWLYVTSGMSNPTDGEHGQYSGMGYEFVMETNTREDWAIKRLASMLAFNLLLASGFFGDKPWLEAGDRVPLNETVDGSEESEIKHFLLNEPKHFASLHELESGELDFVHFLGVTSQEIDWAQQHDSDQLNERLMAAGVGTITDPSRKSII